MLERTATLRWVAALFGLTVPAGCASAASSAREGTPMTAVADVGSPGSGQPYGNDPAGSCVPAIVPPPSSPGLATTWPTEHADVWRTHAAAAGLPAGLGQMKLHTATAALPPVPVWGYVGTGCEVYVMGGAPYLLDMFTKLIKGAPRASIPLLVKQSQAYSQTTPPYVARVDTQTMKAAAPPPPATPGLVATTSSSTDPLTAAAGDARRRAVRPGPAARTGTTGPAG